LRDEVTAVRAEAEAAAQDAGRRLRASDDERLRLTTALTAQTALAEDLQLQVCDSTSACLSPLHALPSPLLTRSRPSLHSGASRRARSPLRSECARRSWSESVHCESRRRRSVRRRMQSCRWGAS
jgi:hypothetical protein